MSLTTGAKDDFISLARTASRETFVSACRFPFLLGSQLLTKPVKPGRTLLVTPVLRENMIDGRPKRATPAPFPSDLQLHPVRKVQEAFPSMITVGRTANNDIVVPDVQISKFHAFFRFLDGGGMEVADAGSRNGTFVGARRLAPKVEQRVRSGDVISFGNLAFELLEAGACWDRLRK